MNMITTHQLQKQLEALWTTADVCSVLRRTSMTVHTWRQTRGLPALEVPGSKRPAIRFVPSDVYAWAKKNEVDVYPLGSSPPVKQPGVKPPSVPRLKYPSSVKRLTFADWAAT